jgi:hypothetical protein
MVADEASATSASISAQIARLMQQPVNQPVLDAANGLLDKYALRSLDAVQLGCAVIVRDLMSAQGMRFIASDHAFLSAAKDEGFEIWDPCETDWT